MKFRRNIFAVSGLLTAALLSNALVAQGALFGKKAKTEPLVQPQATNTPVAASSAPPVAVTPAASPEPAAKPEIVWDAHMKEIHVPQAEQVATIFFEFTNISPVEVVFTVVRPSCGCTTAKLPPLPWTNAPGATGRMDFSINVAGKTGTLFKQVTVESTAGRSILQFKVIMPDPVVMRQNNQTVAAADRQAVLKTDCASCHVTPAVGKMGEDLYRAACAICHEAEHRATMVADLHNLKHPTDREFWKTWITYGKPGSLMPAFAKSQDGFLTDEQIESLADYLAKAIPSKGEDYSGTAAISAH